MNSLSVLKVPVNHRNVLRNVFLKSRLLETKRQLWRIAQICRTKTPRLQFLVNSEIDIPTPPPNTVLKKRGKNLATISERFTGSPVRDYDDVEYVTLN